MASVQLAVLSGSSFRANARLCLAYASAFAGSMRIALVNAAIAVSISPWSE